MGGTQVAVEHIIRVNVGSHDGAQVVQVGRAVGGTARALVDVRARTGSVERRKLALGTAEETVFHTVRGNVDPRDRSQLVEACGTTGTTCPLVATSARAGNVEGFQLAVGTAREVVVNKAAF